MKRTLLLAAALVAALSAGAARAGVEDTVWNAQKERAKALKPANAKRLRDAGAKGDLAFFAVPAMSDLMRLDDTWPEDGALGGTLRFASLYLDDGVATLVEIPWAAAFASMPPETPAWYVEFLNWANGGRSLGGSISVHNRSSFAEMKFEGVDAAARLAIERALLPKAKSVFNAALAAGRNGQAEFWSDPELGDQAFYLAKVKPLVDSIRPYADRVKSGMTDEDVADIWDHAGRAMLNVDHDIARLRREWLEEKLTEE